MCRNSWHKKTLKFEGEDTERSPSPSNSKIILAVYILRKLIIPDMGLFFCFFNLSNTRYGRGCNLDEKQLKISSPSPRPVGHHT